MLTDIKWDDIANRWEVIFNGEFIASYHCLDRPSAVKHLENLQGKVVQLVRPTKLN
ncbi:MAG: hypothetical protein V4493_03010 [Pseudomonadota bacterium]